MIAVTKYTLPQTNITQATKLQYGDNDNMNLTQDEIVEIIELGEEDTIDIETDGNHLFMANDILTHNSSHEEIEYDHSHISGGISKINTADNVIGIFVTPSMKEAGRYQIQFMKTRSSSGVGQKVDLKFSTKSLRISDLEEHEKSAIEKGSANIMDKLKRNSVMPEQKPASNVLQKSAALRDILAKKT